jgi:predicted ester cyclase
MFSKKLKIGLFVVFTSIASLVILPTSASADDKTTVQAFYEFLSNPDSESHAHKFRSAVDAKWESVGNYSGKNKSREQFIGQMGGFAKLIPDLNWAVAEMIQQDNRVVVRGRATGTPVGRFSV